jgi:hypothetical protein
VAVLFTNIQRSRWLVTYRLPSFLDLDAILKREWVSATDSLGSDIDPDLFNPKLGMLMISEFGYRYRSWFFVQHLKN